MKDFIISMLLIFAIEKVGGKGNFSGHEGDELFKGTMHYFYSYDYFHLEI